MCPWKTMMNTKTMKTEDNNNVDEERDNALDPDNVSSTMDKYFA